MYEDTKALLKSSFGNALSVAGYISTASTFFPLMVVLHPYLRTLGIVLIIVGLFRGAQWVIAGKTKALISLRATSETEIEKLRSEKNQEIAILNERITELSRKPYTEELKRITNQVLQYEMTLEGRHVLRHLMMHEPIEMGRAFMPEISNEHQQQQLSIAFRSGIVRHTEERHGGALIRTNWTISPQFRPVLEDVLYAEQ